jgi:lactoylglutathione lyase
MFAGDFEKMPSRPPEERNLKLSEIHHLAIGVADLEASLRFYEEILGLRRTLQMPVGGAVTEEVLGLAPGTTGRSAYVQGPTRVGQIELIEWSTERRHPVADAGQTGPFLIAFELLEGEMEEVRERLDAASIPYRGPVPTEVANYGPITMFITWDPDGTMIELLTLPSDDEVREFRARGGADA